MQQVLAFCMAGSHTSDRIVGTLTVSWSGEQYIVPSGWQLVRASFDRGEWRYDPNGPARIMACPEHLLIDCTKP